ncbi:unnamed protein product, partial [Taenia asiatica]|uniref:Skp1_POZ domain-containing protein n=1 Tax=Taenia asiatica TaxID=60517 RepID=A0A0R3VXL7_TAEAS
MPVKLVTSDEVTFDVDVEQTTCLFSIVPLSSMLLDVGPEAAGDDEPIPLQYVDSDILSKVIQWCTHHKDDAPQQDQDGDRERQTDDISSWDQEFLQVDQG